MVGSIKTCYTLAKVIPLIAVLNACFEPEEKTTIINLKHAQGQKLESVLRNSLPPETNFQIVDNQIVIDAIASDIEPTLSLIEKLDTPPQAKQYIIYFRPTQKSGRHKTYSTRKSKLMTTSLRLTEGIQARISSSETVLFPFFEQETTLSLGYTAITVTPVNSHSASVSFDLSVIKNGKNTQYKSNWNVPFEQWTPITPTAENHSNSKHFSTNSKQSLNIEVKLSPAN